MDINPEDVEKLLTDPTLLGALQRGLSVTVAGIRISYRRHRGELRLNGHVCYSASWLELTDAIEQVRK